MKKLLVVPVCLLFLSFGKPADGLPECYSHVDQVFWVVSDMERTLEAYKQLGFNQFADLEIVSIASKTSKSDATARLVRANLGGAQVNWIQPMTGNSVFHEFVRNQGDGAMSLVHRFASRKEMKKEIRRLSDLGVGVLEKMTITAGAAEMEYVLMGTAGNLRRPGGRKSKWAEAEPIRLRHRGS